MKTTEAIKADGMTVVVWKKEGDMVLQKRTAQFSERLTGFV